MPTDLPSMPPLPTARLTCGHYMRISVGQALALTEVLCETCRTLQRPRVVLLREWHVECKSCDWSRWVGQLESDARKARDWHLRNGKYAHLVRYAYAIVPGMEYAMHTSQPLETHTTEATDEHHDQLF